MVLEVGGWGRASAESARLQEKARKDDGDGFWGFLGDVGQHALGLSLSGGIQKGIGMAVEAVNDPFQQEFDNWMSSDERLIKLQRDSSNANNAIERARAAQKAALDAGITLEDHYINKQAAPTRDRMIKLWSDMGNSPDDFASQSLDAMTYDWKLGRANKMAARDRKILEYDSTALTPKERIEGWNEEFNPRSKTAVGAGLTATLRFAMADKYNDEKVINRMFAVDENGQYLDRRIRNVAGINQLVEDAKWSGDVTGLQDKLKEINNSTEKLNKVLRPDQRPINKRKEFYGTNNDGEIVLREEVTVVDPRAGTENTHIIDKETFSGISERTMLKDAPTVNSLIKNVFGITNSRRAGKLRQDIMKEHPYISHADFGVTPRNIGAGNRKGRAFTYGEYADVISDITRIVGEKGYDIDFDKAQKDLINSYTTNIFKNKDIYDAYTTYFASPPVDPITKRPYPTSSEVFQRFLTDRVEAHTKITGFLNLMLTANKAVVGLSTGEVAVDYSQGVPITVPLGHTIDGFKKDGSPTFAPIVDEAGRSQYSEKELESNYSRYIRFMHSYNSNVEQDKLFSEEGMTHKIETNVDPKRGSLLTIPESDADKYGRRLEELGGDLPKNITQLIKEFGGKFEHAKIRKQWLELEEERKKQESQKPKTPESIGLYKGGKVVPSLLSRVN